MKNLKILILAVLLSGIISSCATHQRSPAYGARYGVGNGQTYYDGTPGLVASRSGGFFANGSTERKVLLSARLYLRVENPDTASLSIEKIAKKYKGYVNEIGTYRTIIRVKSDRLNDAIDDISILGKLQSKKLAGQDVTDSYLDYKIRLENAEKARGRYLELLAKAENVKAALKVEKELERLNGTIDLLKGKMSRINHLAELSTITVYITKRKKPGLLGYIGLGLYHSVKWLFVRN